MTDPIGSGPPRLPLERRRFMVAIAGGLLAAPIAAEASYPISPERALAGSHCDRSGQLRVLEITPWFRD